MANDLLLRSMLYIKEKGYNMESFQEQIKNLYEAGYDVQNININEWDEYLKEHMEGL
jgi:hypothetical protein